MFFEDVTSIFFSAGLSATRKHPGERATCQENTNYGWNLSAFLIWHVFVACFILLAQFSSSRSTSESHTLCVAQNMDAWLFSGYSVVTLPLKLYSCIYHAFLLVIARYCSRDFWKSCFHIGHGISFMFFRLLKPYNISPTNKHSTKYYCFDWKEFCV